MWKASEEMVLFFVGNEECLRCVLSFMIGVLLCEVYQRVPKCRGKVISYFWLALIIGCIVCDNRLINGIAETSMVIFVLCPFMICSALYIPLFEYIYSLRIMQWLGIISMDIYMWHWVVRVYLGSRPFYLEQRAGEGFCILIIAALFVAIMSHFVLVPCIYRVREKKA